MHFLVIITIIIFVIIILPAKLIFLYTLSAQTNDPRKILETVSRARFFNSAHCKNTNGFSVLALPILFCSGSPIVVVFCFLAWKLPLHAEKDKQNGKFHGSSGGWGCSGARASSFEKVKY